MTEENKKLLMKNAASDIYGNNNLGGKIRKRGSRKLKIRRGKKS